jgi:hypothetical protein
MRPGFDASDRQRIEAALRAGSAPLCPVCGERLTGSAVDPPESVAYVRRRLLLVCPGCGRSAAFDRPRAD